MRWEVRRRLNGEKVTTTEILGDVDGGGGERDINQCFKNRK
ncbi:hypothetical protein Hanom_Chr06g00538141 [Helianthus anomalus]